jgi:hypothetical protein
MFLRRYLYVRLKGHTNLCLYVRLNVHTTVSVCQIEGSYESVSVCKVEGLYDSVSTCPVERISLKRLRIHKVSCAQKSERSCLETLRAKDEYRFTMPLVYFSSSVLCFFINLRIS